MIENVSESRRSAERDPARLKAAVLRFLETTSIDTIPAAAEDVERWPKFLPAGRRIYVGQPPGTALEDVTALVTRLAGMGYRPIPQFAAREVVAKTQLCEALAAFRALGVTEAFVIAGDRPGAAGPYDDTLAVLGTGLLADYGITTIGIAGYPEGNRVIGPTALSRALAAKAELAAACGWTMYIVTQLSFDPSAVLGWIERTTRGGIDLPVHVGLPGLGSLRDLIGFSRRCGVGASMRTLVAKASALADSARLTTTSDLVLAYAQALATRPEPRVAGARFYAFAGVEETARWIGRMRAGEFEIARVNGHFTLEA